MKRQELIRELRKIVKKAGLSFEIFTRQRKGSHYIIRIGNKMSTIKSGEITRQMEKIIKKQLGL